MIQQTSLIAFGRNKKKKLKIADRVFDVLGWAYNGLTAYEVAEELNLPITSIRPRLTDLFNAGLVIEYGTKYDIHCNQTCIIYRRRNL